MLILIAIRLFLFLDLVLWPDLAKAFNMITNLLGSSVILMGSSVCKLFILGVALGNVLNLKSKYVLTA